MPESFESAFIDRWLRRSRAGWAYTRVRMICSNCGREHPVFESAQYGLRCARCADLTIVQELDVLLHEEEA